MHIVADADSDCTGLHVEEKGEKRSWRQEKGEVSVLFCFAFAFAFERKK